MKLPALGESVTEGTVTRWLKQVGDTVEVDEPLLEVSTDKVDTEIPSPVAGTLLEIGSPRTRPSRSAPSSRVIGAAGAAAAAAPAPRPAPAPAAPARRSRPPRQPRRAAPAPAPAPAAPRPRRAGSRLRPRLRAGSGPGTGAGRGSGRRRPVDGRRGGYVTPLVRKLAAEHGVDLAALTGTGVGGRIRKQDVLDAAEPGARPRRPRPQPAPAAAGGRGRRRRPRRARCAAAPRSCPGCARSSPSGWSSRCRSRRS